MQGCSPLGGGGVTGAAASKGQKTGKAE
jgi:hypothetical protein